MKDQRQKRKHQSQDNTAPGENKSKANNTIKRQQNDLIKITYLNCNFKKHFANKCFQFIEKLKNY